MKPLYWQVGFLSEAQVGGYPIERVIEVVSCLNIFGLLIKKDFYVTRARLIML